MLTRALLRNLLALAIIGSSVSGCGSGDTEVKRDSFEAIVGDWPLTVDSAVVACGVRNKLSVGVTVNGKKYALNGTAKTFEGWSPLDAIWAPNPEIPGSKVNVGDLIDYAARKCAEQN